MTNTRRRRCRRLCVEFREYSVRSSWTSDIGISGSRCIRDVLRIRLSFATNIRLRYTIYKTLYHTVYICSINMVVSRKACGLQRRRQRGATTTRHDDFNQSAVSARITTHKTHSYSTHPHRATHEGRRRRRRRHFVLLRVSHTSGILSRAHAQRPF